MKKTPVYPALISLLISLGCNIISQSSETPSTEATTQGAPAPTATVSDALPGLVYGAYNRDTNEEAIWQVGENGKVEKIISGYSHADFSPDGDRAIVGDNIYAT
ncbi:MAG: hypothetical protein DPW15_15250, partial [Chloroflexi bacterium]|nr:hypothetical protein [Chloroflexota bacterium]